MSTPPHWERTERLRAIPLTDILRAIDARPDPHDPLKWHTPRGALSVNGTKFFNWHKTTGGGGAIDLIMHLHSLDFKDAIAWLALRFAVPPSAALNASAHTQRRLLLPAPVADALPTIIRYLSIQRRLPLIRLHHILNSGNLYADHKNNAVFLLRDKNHTPVGAELRGTGHETWRGMAPGSRRENGYFAVGPPRPKIVVLCESAIDAISCHSLNHDRLCISTSGACPNPAWLPAVLSRDLPTYCGFDADATGERMAQSMIAHHHDVQRLRPPCHDWNDALRAKA
jgi:hypothetical protein